MSEHSGTSIQRLEALLQAGKITQEQYESLSAALESPRARNGSGPRKREGQPMRRTWHNRQLLGVCGGIARSAGVSSFHVRLLFFLLLLFTGGAAFLLYLGLAIIIPWDEHETPRFSRKLGEVLMLLVALCLLTALHAIVLAQFPPRIRQQPDRFPALLLAPGHMSVSIVFGISVVLSAVYGAMPDGRVRNWFLWTVICAMLAFTAIQVAAIAGYG